MPKEAATANLLLEVLTPIAKSWPSENCLEANSLAIQIYGGYGYTRDFPVEQYWRDNRLNMIHEGTHGIQAVDLLGRKVLDAGRCRPAAAGDHHPSHHRTARGSSRPWPLMPAIWARHCSEVGSGHPKSLGHRAIRRRRWRTPCLTCRRLAIPCWHGCGWT